MRRAHAGPDAGDDVRARRPALERRHVEAQPGEAALAVADALEVVAVERGADRADERAPEPQPVDRPALVVVEAADLALDALRGEGRGAAAPPAGAARQVRSSASLVRLMALPHGTAGPEIHEVGVARAAAVREPGAERGVVQDLGARAGIEQRHRDPGAASPDLDRAVDAGPGRRAVRPRQREPDLRASGRRGNQRVGRRAGGSRARRRSAGVRRPFRAVGPRDRSRGRRRAGAEEDPRAHSDALPAPGSARATVSGVPSSVTASTSRASGLCRR